MKKMNKKGFMLAETLIVATFLVTTLLFLYIQFNNVTKAYDTSFKYNTVNSLYAVNNIIDYLKTDGLSKLKTALNNNEYINITNCSGEYFEETEYCQVLFTTLKVKTVLFAKEDLTSLKGNNSGLDQTIADFIDYLNYEQIDAYRVIAEFEDNTLAILKMD